jgi:hypothetical protein
MESLNKADAAKLERLFRYYCEYAPASSALDNVKWFKCISELGALSAQSRLTRAEVDLVFTRVKSKGERKIGLQQFINGLAQVAQVIFGKDEKAALSRFVSEYVRDEKTPKSEVAIASSEQPFARGKPASGDEKAEGKSQPRLEGDSPEAEARAFALYDFWCAYAPASNEGIDNVKFFKMVKEAQWLDGGDGEPLQPVDVDLVFTKSLQKGHRRLRAGEFLDALRKLGMRKFPQTSRPLDALIAAAGQIVATLPVKPVPQASSRKSADQPAFAEADDGDQDEGVPLTGRPAASPKPAAAAAAAAPAKTVGKPSIFDKLTDPRLYTGAHKHRFDADGVGLGLAGRDSVSKGRGTTGGKFHGDVVDNLAQITRPNLR